MFRIASPPSAAIAPANRGSTTASIADAMIGIPSSTPQNLWPSSTSAGSIVTDPGASETSSKPYDGRRPSTFERKTRRFAGALAVWSSTDGLLGAMT
jgi:hypothetical protein